MTAIASSPADRATALLTPEAAPTRRSGAAPSTAAVSGDTAQDSPRPSNSTDGKTSVTYDASAPIRVPAANPAAASSVPSVISGRGPSRSDSPPARADSKSISTVAGKMAVPAVDR